jgi:hypothetical protein
LGIGVGIAGHTCAIEAYGFIAGAFCGDDGGNAVLSFAAQDFVFGTACRCKGFRIAGITGICIGYASAIDAMRIGVAVDFGDSMIDACRDFKMAAAFRGECGGITSFVHACAGLAALFSACDFGDRAVHTNGNETVVEALLDKCGFIADIAFLNIVIANAGIAVLVGTAFAFDDIAEFASQCGVDIASWGV